MSGTATPPGKSTKVGGLLKDKKVQIGIGAAAVLGLVALLRSQQAGGAGGQDGDGSTPQSVQPAVMDSSGTDVYNAIQSLGQGWQNDLLDYSSKLDSLSSQVAKNTTGLQSVTTAIGKIKSPAATVTKPVVKTPAKTTTKPKSSAKYVTVAKFTSSGTKWNSTLSGIAKHYKVSTATLKKLNPKITNINKIYAGQKIRVK